MCLSYGSIPRGELEAPGGALWISPPCVSLAELGGPPQTEVRAQGCGWRPTVPHHGQEAGGVRLRSRLSTGDNRHLCH